MWTSHAHRELEKKMELVEIASSMMTTKGLGYWRAVGEALIKEHTVYDG